MNKSRSLVYFKDSCIEKNELQPKSHMDQQLKEHKQFRIKVIKNSPQSNADHFDKVGKISHKKFSITRNSLQLKNSNSISQSLFIIDPSNNNDQKVNKQQIKTFIIQSIPKNEQIKAKKEN